jgi:glycosyltransferase involved in cell wall biosynthesis
MATSGRPRKRLLFIDRGDASFIRTDLDLLGAFADIRRLSFVTRLGWRLPFALLRQLGRCWSAVNDADIVLVHFAGWNSWIPLALARLRKKPSLLFLHGTDAVSLPSIGYGNFRKWPLSAVTRSSLRMAGRIVPVSEALVRSSNDYATGTPLAQGILSFVPDLKTPIDVLHHGFDPSEWPYGEGPRDIDVLTVASGSDPERTCAIKGVDLLIAAARLMPERSFVLVGSTLGQALDLPSNFIALAALPPAELAAFYQRAKCYAQLSRSEGFGCALAEAMLCGAIPVVSNVGVMPEIAGGTGAVLQKPAPETLMDLLGQLFDHQNLTDRSMAARQHIVQRYPRSARAAGLRRLLSQ